MVEIANPIYDVVFKYLMRDEKVAKLLLSAIIGKEVVSLEFRPTEHHFPVGELLTVLRMDFNALIVDADGNQELVILELQKAKMAGDIMRFRRYLVSNMPPLPILPILSIYLLGHTLDHVKAPVVRVNRAYFDAATGEQIHEKEEFIESLTHDSIIIQIPYLEGRRRTELEQLLALFDQSSATTDPHFLAIDEDELPEHYRPLLRRLQKAVADPVVRETMEAEDDIIEEIKDYQRRIMSKEQIIEAKDKAIEAKEQIIEAKDRAIEAKEQIIEAKDKAIEAKERTIEEKQKIIARAILKFYATGRTIQEIADIFELKESEVVAILDQVR